MAKAKPRENSLRDFQDAVSTMLGGGTTESETPQDPTKGKKTSGNQEDEE